MSGARRDRYGLRQVDSFEQAIGIKPRDINLPPLKSTEIYNSPAFQALFAQQQAVETEAELEARKAQLYALMKRVAAEKRLPIEDIKRAVNDVAKGGGGGGSALPAPRGLPAPVMAPQLQLRDGEEVGGDAMAALMQHVQQAAAVPEGVLPLELHTHQGVKAAIAAAGAEHDELAIDTQAQESIRALDQRQEDMRVARQQRESIARLFSLESAGKAASAVGRGAYFLGTNVLLPTAQVALAIPGAVLQGSAALGGGLDALGNAAGAASEGVNWMLEDPEVVREHRQRALPYTSALEDIRYDARDEDEPRPARPRAGGSSSSAGPRDRTSNQVGQTSSSSSTAMVPAVPRGGSTYAPAKKLRITREDLEGVMGKLSAVRDFGFGVGGVGY